MTDLGVCEWNPGFNRSTVDPIQAVFRLDLPPPVRGALIAKMRRHAYDDLVTITRDGISSDSGAGQYAAVISNMNFGTGRLCRSVTRTRWTATQRESAIVYVVGEYSVGYAAACGNLFVLARRAADPPARAQPVGVAMEPGGGAPVSGPAAPDEVAEPATFARAAEPWSVPPVVWSPIPWAPPIIVPTPPVAAVPEIGARDLMALGLAAVAGLVLRRRLS